MDHASQSEISAKPQTVLSGDTLTLTPGTSKTITAIVGHPPKWNTTGTVTLLDKLTDTASLLISYSMSTIIDSKVAVRVTNTTESPYSTKRNTQIAEFFVINPEQFKFIRPVDTVTLSMIPDRDPDLTTNLSKILKTTTPEQQNNKFKIPPPENPGKCEYHTSIETRLLKNLHEES